MPALSDIPAHYDIARSWRCSALSALSASAPGTLGICFLVIFFLSPSQTFAATVTNRVTVAANWNTAATWIQNRTGTVTFTEGATTLASNVAVNGAGQASFNISTLGVGSHVITAAFTGSNGWQSAIYLRSRSLP